MPTWDGPGLRGLGAAKPDRFGSSGLCGAGQRVQDACVKFKVSYDISYTYIYIISIFLKKSYSALLPSCPDAPCPSACEPGQPASGVRLEFRNRVVQVRSRAIQFPARCLFLLLSLVGVHDSACPRSTICRCNHFLFS